jgi:cytosine/adenosine deaminase-related metal-dependent hydrolase
LVKQFTQLANFPPRLIHLITLAGALEMMRSGITSVLDHFWMAQSLNLEGLEAAMQAYAVSGMRASLAPMVEDQDLVMEQLKRVNPHLASVEEGQEKRAGTAELLSLLQSFIERWHGQQKGRLRCLPGPGGPQWCSTRLLRGCQDLAQRFNTGLHLHLGETRLQDKVCRSVYGQAAILEMERIGILSPNTSIAHCVWISGEEICALARTGTVVVHNPVSNLRLGSGIAPILPMLDSGVIVALGTDGAASNDNQNMFTVMKLMGLLHSPATQQTNSWLTARQVLESATSGGARVMGCPNKLGRIAKGYMADLVLLNLEHEFWTPVTDAIQYLVFCETGSSIRYVIIDGQVVFEKGEFGSILEKDVYQELNEQVTSYFEQNPQSPDKLAPLLNDWKAALDCIMTSEEKQQDD